MRNNITIFTVSKENKVLFLETNLTDFLKGFEKIEANAPHYNTLYKNFAKEDIYIKGEYCFQKFTAEQINEVVLSSANPK